jgi:restriction endonuclease S subunit
MSKLTLLNSLAEITTGFTFRTSIKDEAGKTAVLQAKNFTNFEIDYSKLPKVNYNFDADRLLKNGDILLTSRGSFRSAVHQSNYPTVASSSLYVIRLRDAECMPEFLALYLNSTYGQSYLNQNATGAAIKSVSIRDLKLMAVPQIPIERQKCVIALSHNIEKQISLIKAKESILNDLIAGVVTNSIKGAA